jgi:hypothetical protein
MTGGWHDMAPTITEIRDHVLRVLERRGLEMPPPDPEERVRMLAAWPASELCPGAWIESGLFLTYSEYRDGRKRLGVGREQQSGMLFGVEWVADEPPTIIEDCQLVRGEWIAEVMALSLTPDDDFGGFLGLPAPSEEHLNAGPQPRHERRPGGGWRTKSDGEA